MSMQAQTRRSSGQAAVEIAEGETHLLAPIAELPVVVNDQAVEPSGGTNGVLQDALARLG